MVKPNISEIHSALQASLSDRSHPFRHFCLATSNRQGYPTQRTVILRSVSPDLELSFYTDSRSEKVGQIRENPRVSLLFYHPQDLWQLRIQGHAAIQEIDQSLPIWESLPKESRKNYRSIPPPGSSIAAYDEVQYLSDTTYFCRVEIRSIKVESLQLNYTPHKRRLLWKEKSQWKETYLVP